MEVEEKSIERKKREEAVSFRLFHSLFTLRSPSPLLRRSSIECCISLIRARDESVGT